MLAVVPDAAVIVSAGGHIVQLTPQAAAIFGYSQSELRGLPVELLVPEGARGKHAALHEAYRAAPRKRAMGAVDRPLMGRRKDGRLVPLEISLSPIVTSRGRETIVVIRDVSERVNAAEERLKRVQAEEALRVRDEFLAVASHELRTPLCSLAMNVEVLQHVAGRMGQEERARDRAEAIRRATDRLTRLVDRLLELSRVGSNEPRLERVETDLADLVRQVAGQFAEQLSRASCELTICTCPGVHGQWDPLRLEQVLWNLLSNAIKFGHGNPIEVTVDTPREGTARLVVQDHGPGIAPADHGRIFERFERAVNDRCVAGLGLGLWIARKIVRAHGGDVSVASAPGRGAAFTVELPA